jgi:hypothetical protein
VVVGVGAWAEAVAGSVVGVVVIVGIGAIVGAQNDPR